MSWMELRLDTTAEAVDWVCTLLATTRYTSDVQITRYSATDQAAHDWTFTLCLYLPCNANTEADIVEIGTVLLPLHRTNLSTELQITPIADKPIGGSLVHRIGQRFVVLAADLPYRSQSVQELTLRLKPSLAFGSGLHPATILSLELLERHIMPSMNVLDLGSGSGILSVAMAKLGAEVLAVDNDRVAVQATQDAVDRNGVEQQVKVRAGSLGQGSTLGHWMGGEALNEVPTINWTEPFDLIVANILARIHIALAPDFRKALQPVSESAGLLITAGFTSDYEPDVTAALAAVGFETIDAARCNEWVALTHRLPAQ